MSAAWKEKTLSSVLKLEYGKPLEKDYRKADGLYPAYGANGEKARTDKYYHDKPSIIVGRKGSAGEINLTAEKFWPLDVTYFVTFDEKNYDLRFLFHLLTTLNLPSLAKGVKPGINRNDVYSKKVKFPPIEEQKRIVSILDESFKAIDIAKANTEKNLQNVRALFDSILHDIFSKQGDGWVTTTLDKISENLDSKRIPITKSKRKAGTFPYYGASGIVDYVADYIFEGDALLVSEDGANLLARSTPIAFSVSGKYWVNNHAHILKFQEIATQKYVEFYLESIKIDSYVTGAAQPKLNQKLLNTIPIPIPKETSTQSKIVHKILELQASTQQLESTYQKKLAALEELKKSLLHHAFCGGL